MGNTGGTVLGHRPKHVNMLKAFPIKIPLCFFLCWRSIRSAFLFHVLKVRSQIMFHPARPVHLLFWEDINANIPRNILLYLSCNVHDYLLACLFWSSVWLCLKPVLCVATTNIASRWWTCSCSHTRFEILQFLNKMVVLCLADPCMAHTLRPRKQKK